MMEEVRKIQKKLTKDKKKKSKFLGLFLVFRECVAIKIRHKRFHYGQHYLDVWIGKKGRKALPLCHAFSMIYLEKAYENWHENVRLPYELLSIRIDDTAIEFSFVKSADREKTNPSHSLKHNKVSDMPLFRYEKSDVVSEEKKEGEGL